jgi:Domain of unknown function (DUF4386)
MSTSVMTERIAEPSPCFTARMAGVFYVLTAVTSVFGQFFTLGKLVVQGNAAATATNILAPAFFSVGLRSIAYLNRILYRYDGSVL